MSSKVCMILVWFFVIFLLVVGLVMVSSTAAWSEETVNPYEPLIKQSIFAGIGLLGAIVISRIDYRLWRKYIVWIYLFACFLLILCFVPGIGKEINGASRWITIGMQFQPSECAKLCMIMALAHYMALYRDKCKTLLRGAILPGFIAAIPLGLIFFEKDMGTAVALAAAGACLIFVAGTRLIYLLIAAVAAGGLLYFSVQGSSNRSERIKAWRNLEAYATDEGLQQYRASIALARGDTRGDGHGMRAAARTAFVWASAQKNTAPSPSPILTSSMHRWVKSSALKARWQFCWLISS